jgi:S1-C subfamily serine protease
MTLWGRQKREKPAAPAPSEPTTGYGTGFFVNGTGQLVTSFHVIDGASKIVVYAADGIAREARVYRASPATDLAVLNVNFTPKYYLSLAAPNSYKPGDRVFTFGFPVIEMLGSEPKFTDGSISSLSGAGDEAAFAQISVPVQPGNSGGPLVNERGQVVGVIAAGAENRQFAEAAGTLPQNVNWAVRSEYLAPLVNPGRTAIVRSRDEAVALVRESVAIVFVEK